jgi:hypothetical protein
MVNKKPGIKPVSEILAMKNLYLPKAEETGEKKGLMYRADRDSLREKEALKKKKIGLEKVLNCSASEYVESVGKNLGDYELVGVHHAEYESDAKHFVKYIPKNAEVVVNFTQHYLDDSYYYANGTALIPKNLK